ncbi:hypothetical protein AAMO2058_000482600 [Amorphochlora amoebiformis]
MAGRAWCGALAALAVISGLLSMNMREDSRRGRVGASSSSVGSFEREGDSICASSSADDRPELPRISQTPTEYAGSRHRRRSASRPTRRRKREVRSRSRDREGYRRNRDSGRKHQTPRTGEFNSNKGYRPRGYPPREYPSREYPSREYPSREYPSREYPSRGYPSPGRGDRADLRPKETGEAKKDEKPLRKIELSEAQKKIVQSLDNALAFQPEEESLDEVRPVDITDPNDRDLWKRRKLERALQKYNKRLLNATNDPIVQSRRELQQMVREEDRFKSLKSARDLFEKKNSRVHSTTNTSWEHLKVVHEQNSSWISGDANLRALKKEMMFNTLVLARLHPRLGMLNGSVVGSRKHLSHEEIRLLETNKLNTDSSMVMRSGMIMRCRIRGRVKDSRIRCAEGFSGIQVVNSTHVMLRRRILDESTLHAVSQSLPGYGYLHISNSSRGRNNVNTTLEESFTRNSDRDITSPKAQKVLFDAGDWFVNGSYTRLNYSIWKEFLLRFRGLYFWTRADKCTELRGRRRGRIPPSYGNRNPIKRQRQRDQPELLTLEELKEVDSRLHRQMGGFSSRADYVPGYGVRKYDLQSGDNVRLVRSRSGARKDEIGVVVSPVDKDMGTVMVELLSTRQVVQMHHTDLVSDKETRSGRASHFFVPRRGIRPRLRRFGDPYGSKRPFRVQSGEGFSMGSMKSGSEHVTGGGPVAGEEGTFGGPTAMNVTIN